MLIGQLTAYLLNFGTRLTLGKYDVAVLRRAISILGIILLAAGLWRRLSYTETIYSEDRWECFNWLSYAGGALIKVADSAGSTVFSSQFIK